MVNPDQAQKIINEFQEYFHHGRMDDFQLSALFKFLWDFHHDYTHIWDKLDTNERIMHRQYKLSEL